MSDIIKFEPRNSAPGSIPTPTHDEIMFILQDCHAHGFLGVIRGGVGIGKTFAFEQYIAAHQCSVAKVTLDPSNRSMTAGLVEIARAIAEVVEWFETGSGLITSYTTSSAHAARQAIVRFSQDIKSADGRLLLIVDEAQHAHWNLLEVLRALYDKGCFGLVVSGNEKLFRRGKMDDADFGRALQSRMLHVIDRPEPLPEDVAAILQHYRIKGAEAHKLLAQHAAAGGLRKVFQIIQKAREISEGSQIGLPQLKAAAASTGLTAIGWGRSR